MVGTCPVLRGLNQGVPDHYTSIIPRNGGLVYCSGFHLFFKVVHNKLHTSSGIKIPTTGPETIENTKNYPSKLMILQIMQHRNYQIFPYYSNYLKSLLCDMITKLT